MHLKQAAHFYDIFNADGVSERAGVPLSPPAPVLTPGNEWYWSKLIMTAMAALFLLARFLI